MKKKSTRRSLQVDPRFEMKIGNFVNSRLEITPPRSPRDPSMPPRSHITLDPKKSKLNTKALDLDSNYYPEEIVAMHTYGFSVAHRNYVQNVADSYEKQWEDDERVRRCKSCRIKVPTDPVKRRKDQHLLERIIQDSKKKDRVGRSNSVRTNFSKTQRVSAALPPETRFTERRTSPRIFYFG